MIGKIYRDVMIVRSAKLSHKNKVSEGLERFSNIKIVGYHFEDEKYLEEDYDTFIWTKEILEPSEIKTWEETILKEMEKGKNIYNMARLYRIADNHRLVFTAEEYGIEYFDSSDPQAFQRYIYYAKLGLEKIRGKVITVMGTGRKSGKFTTSLILKRELGRYFEVGGVGTEPHSKLCNMEEMVIPQVIPLCHVASTIFGAIKKVDLKDKDVILVSSQTGIFSDPLEVGTGRGGGVVSLSILYGSKPDYIILASNTLNVEEIERHIKVLEMLSNKKVIGITINGRRFKNLGENYREILDKISKRLNIPVVDVVKRTYLEEFIDEYICNIL
ncbi:hypothetical protein MHHB_P0335 [Methanofervidicoccus abyssi]|uniref:D-glutamate N-acetyltransferase-like C-terminal domain-containing protein n=2 Tax=Methanofervidicoccus abyssi TaxID=2082189 RepID=A0A401HPF2_9EURY|nr:hypothetical protein MHHB_P0335 [Methanofervidicoccus abyssi]